MPGSGNCWNCCRRPSPAPNTRKRSSWTCCSRVALIKFLTQEIGAQFANLLLEAKEWIRSRGEYFERSEQAHVMKARLAELQANRRNIYRQVGQHIYQILAEFEENQPGARAPGAFRRRAEAAPTTC